MTDDYFTRLLRAHAQGAFQPGTVTVISVLHEDGCKRPDGGPCTCRPDMRTSPLTQIPSTTTQKETQ